MRRVISQKKTRGGSTVNPKSSEWSQGRGATPETGSESLALLPPLIGVETEEWEASSFPLRAEGTSMISANEGVSLGSEIPPGQEVTEWLDWILCYEPGVVGVLKVAVDESGTRKDDPCLVMAACVATSRQWGMFVDEWTETSKGRVPEGKHYHAQERWCEEGGLNDELPPLMDKYLDYRLVVTLSESDYRKNASEKYRSQFGSSYTTCAMSLIVHLAERNRRVGGGKMAFLFEAGHRKHEYLMKLLGRSIDSPEFRDQFRIQSATYAGKGNKVLHPSDLLAHEVFSSYGKKRLTYRQETLREKSDLVDLSPEVITRTVKMVWESSGGRIGR